MKNLLALWLLLLASTLSFSKAVNRIPVDTPENEINNFIKEYEDSDRNLNQTYNELYTSLKKPDQEKLKKSELSWIKFRDNECNFQADLSFNKKANRYICLKKLTLERVAHLEDMIDW